MAIKFKGDMTKVVAKNKGDMSKTTLRKRVVQQIINGTATITPAADYYTKMLLHFDDGAAASDSTISAATPMQGVLSPDGTKAYIGSWTAASGNGIHVIDVASGTKTQTFETEGNKIHQLTLNSTGTKIYGTNYNQNKVYIVDTTNGSFSSVTTGTGVHSLAITTNDKFLFVACQNAGLYRIDLTAATPSATLLGDTTWGTFAPVVSPDGTRLYVSLGSSVKAYSLNQDTGAISLLSTLSGFSGAYVATKTSNIAYYSNYSNGTISPVYFSSSTKGANITVGAAPYGSSVSPDGKKLYVANYNGNTVSVIDVSTNSVITTFTGFTSPYGVVATNSKLFVSNNGNSTITVKDISSLSDAAQSPLTQYRIGTVATSTTQSKFGGKSLALNGVNTNKLQFANPKGLKIQLGESDWTIEGWFYFNANNVGYQPLFSFSNDDGNHPGPQIYIESNNTLTYSHSNSAYKLSTIIPNANQWYHIAVSKSNTSIKMFVDGTQVGSTLSTPKLVSTPNYLFLGVFAHAKNLTHFNGYIDGVRIQVGESLYNSNFTAPAGAPTANSYTKLLMNFDSTIKDESTSPLYSYAVGTTAVISSAQSKFGGSSLKMSGGTTDYVKIHNESQPIAFLDRPFTIEGWFYLNVNNAFQPFIAMGSTANFQGPYIGLESNGTLNAYLSNNGSSYTELITSTFVPSTGAWHHVALVRESKAGPIKLYCDGILRGSVNTTSTIVTSDNIWVGYYPYYPGNVAVTLNGYVDEVRITLDYCAYNGNFTPAAAPFTDGKNLLMHFDGANNSTTMTDSSTYGKVATASGGAVISTTKSKFGGSSLYLPGTTGVNGSRVTVSNSSDFAFGTGDFTIEYWANLTALSTSNNGFHSCMVDTRTSTNGGLFFALNPSRKILAWTNGSTFLTSNAAIPLGEWCHIALTRKGSKVYLYINGVLDSTTDVSINLTDNGLIIGNDFYRTSSDSYAFNGYIDEFRVTKGTALYAGGDFTPPTVPFTLIG